MDRDPAVAAVYSRFSRFTKMATVDSFVSSGCYRSTDICVFPVQVSPVGSYALWLNHKILLFFVRCTRSLLV